MPQFTAADGRRYTIEYDLPSVRDIRRAIGIDLIGNDGIQKATSSVIDFAEVLYATCAQQCERQGVSEAEFVRSIQGCLDQVADCWLKAVSDFFDSIGRGALARLAESLVETERANCKEANKLMDAPTARKVTDVQLQANTMARRNALTKLLGEESTPGEKSPS